MFTRLLPVCRFVVVVAAALALSGMTATADDDSPPKPPHKKEASDAEKKRDAKHKRARFKSLDTDGNGELSYQEFIQSDRLKAMPEEKTRRLFAFLDRDKDGKLQEQELRPREPKWLTTVRKNFQKHDLDSSGALEPKEFGEALKNLEEKIQPERLFKKLDKNRDHKLQKNEFRWQHADSKPPRHSPLLDMDIKKHDKNGSGGLDFAEFAKLPFIGRIPEERRKGFFNRLDSDGNGEVSPREIKRAHQKLRRERPPHIKPPSGDHRPPEQGRKKGRGGPPPKRGHGPPSKPPHPVPPEARL